MRFFIALLLICAIGAYITWSDRPIKRPPGILASSAPVQKPISGSLPALDKAGYTIKPLATFEVEARVLSKEDYSFDEGAALAPVDLALGWDKMSDTDVLSHFEISQSGRFYYWSTPEFPIPRHDVETQSANMHMIPATRTIEKRLKSIRNGNLVRFSGYLVEVNRDDGWHWRSSLTRNDTGNGACELVWVETLDVF
ncbi:MAG: hypothetical protein H6970_11325 [Gammaproteobacteria bacterium]|nr:hypothetical protein [Gammaproteobacteria bacterium]MCP5425640.1 hypothetical protein [Gammaproteobacteria bacterium]MCP5458962.1 hypothetical protein [Gammaproteobacteria bacterium]